MNFFDLFLNEKDMSGLVMFHQRLVTQTSQGN